MIVCPLDRLEGPGVGEEVDEEVGDSPVDCEVGKVNKMFHIKLYAH